MKEIHFGFFKLAERTSRKYRKRNTASESPGITIVSFTTIPPPPPL
jgi:hypothetical protein